MIDLILLPGLIFAAAFIYSSVGQGGASGYLAAMALCGVAPSTMKPAALTLNVLVAAIAAVRFGRAGGFAWALFWPFAAASVPLAFLGGAITLPGRMYKPAVGITLLLAALLLLRHPQDVAGGTPGRRLPLPGALTAGAGIGLLSGLTGIGGGIFLAPLVLLAGWAEPRETAGVTAAFILVSSLAGLAGLVAVSAELPGAIPVWAGAAVGGALLGSGMGSRRLGSHSLRKLLSAVLVIAAVRFVVG